MLYNKTLLNLPKLTFLNFAVLISLLVPIISAHADNTPECNESSSDPFTTECGAFSSAVGWYAIAVGVESNASGTSTLAIGDHATASAKRAQAFGYYSNASGVDSLALGGSSNSRNSIAVKGHVTEGSDDSIAIGSGSSIGPASRGAIAIGSKSRQNGTGAQANAEGAISLGSDVINDIPNSMMIKVPLRIEGANSLSDSLYLKSDSIGIGTPTPAKSLHMVTSNGSGAIRIEENNATVQKRFQIQLENNDPTGFKFTDNANNHTWQFSQTPAGGFVIANTANGGQDIVINNDGRVLMGPGPVTNFNLDPNGDLDIPNGSVTANGISLTSSRSSKTDISAIKPTEVMEKLKQVEVAEWRYKKADKNDRHISPMAEDFYSLFKLGKDNKHINPNDLASVAIVAAKELQKENTDLKQQLHLTKSDLKAENNKLKKRLVALEKLVMNLASGESVLPTNGKQVVLKQ